ncbi:MAG: GNAT family N-acetyltransferase [Pseudomonadota bacterium]
MSWEIAEAEGAADLAQCFALRHAVFCVEQGVAEEIERDGKDAAARHLLARVDGVPAGTLRLRVVDDAMKLERVCVSAEARGTGVGAALTRAALAVAVETPGVREAKLGAQVDVVAFYERLGFAAHGPEYVEAGILHRDMTCALPAV